MAAYARARLRTTDRAVEARIPLPDRKGDVWIRPATSDAVVFEKVFVKCEYGTADTHQQGEIVRRYERACSSGASPLIVDLGANVGLSAIWFAQAWPFATILAIEPHPGNFRLLQRNVARYPNITPIQAGIWDRPTILGIVNPLAEPWAIQIAEQDRPDDGVRAITVPDLLREQRSASVFIAKVDIEGAEHQLFRSNTEWLDTVDLVIIEIHDWLYPGQCSSNNFFRAVMRQDREMLIIGENLFCLRKDPVALA
jgi:FkbM family methyltransferase